MSPRSHVADTRVEPANNHRAVVRDHALAALSGTDADGETVKTTVLREFYYQQPSVSLEDILELNVVIAAPDPESGSLSECVETVLSETVEQRGDWANTPLADGGNKNISGPATETH